MVRTRRRAPDAGGRAEQRYELLTCALRGHAFVGVGARTVIEADATFVRERNGVRWYRCLRCDAWVHGTVPDQPTEERVPGRAEIELPARGPILRDRYVLRLIALDRAVHVVVLVTLAVVLVTFARHSQTLHRDYLNIMNDLNGGGPGVAQVRGVLGYLRKAFEYSPRRLLQLALVVVAYAALEASEMVGLWLAKRWAEYLTFVATVALVPLEVYELSLRVSVFKLITLAINLAIVVYLLLAKRLFGLRGGYRAERERRDRLAGWGAVDEATPDVPVPGPEGPEGPEQRGPGSGPHPVPLAGHLPGE